MTREWQPGDVAMFPSGRAFVFERGEGDFLAWMFADGSDMDLGPATFARPLVVIDPEDREQVERLLNFFGAGGKADAFEVELWQAALREFANPTPPKPDEPTGLGAVVEDARGHKYLRCFGDDGYYVWRRSQNFDGCRYKFDEIAVVKVLSEGVTA